MSDLREAAKLALIALENGTSPNLWLSTKENLRKALAQPVDAVNMSQERVDETAKREHEPVAWRNTETGEFCTGGFLRKDLAQWTPLYTAPPKREWVGLTDEERVSFFTKSQNKFWDWDDGVDIEAFIRAIEAKLKEKNT